MRISLIWHDYCKIEVTKSETYEDNNRHQHLHDFVVLHLVAVGFTLLIFFCRV